jgi:hypothetical protein
MVKFAWGHGEYRRAFRAENGWYCIGPSGYVRFTPDNAPAGAVDVRPLVVIDPEDPEQVERLRLLIDQRWAVGACGFGEAISDALREYARPEPPKPEEPTGLFAVVEDADGVLWGRNNPKGIAPWSPANAAADGLKLPYRAWHHLDVVRVLSPGVSPEESR